MLSWTLLQNKLCNVKEESQTVLSHKNHPLFFTETDGFDKSVNILFTHTRNIRLYLSIESNPYGI